MFIIDICLINNLAFISVGFVLITFYQTSKMFRRKIMSIMSFWKHYFLNNDNQRSVKLLWK